MKNQKELTVTIRSLEEKLVAPATRHSIVQLDKLLTDDFIEFGRSGKIFDKQTVVERIGKEETARMTLADFKIVILAPDALLATYCATKIEDDGQKAILYEAPSAERPEINGGCFSVRVHQPELNRNCQSEGNIVTQARCITSIILNL